MKKKIVGFLARLKEQRVRKLDGMVILGIFLFVGGLVVGVGGLVKMPFMIELVTKEPQGVLALAGVGLMGWGLLVLYWADERQITPASLEEKEEREDS